MSETTETGPETGQPAEQEEKPAETASTELDGKVLATIKAPGPAPCGLTFDGECLWVSDRQERKICRITRDTGQVLFSIAFDGDLTGTAWDGSHLWQADQAARTVSRINPESGAIELAIKVEMANGDVMGLCYESTPEGTGGLWYGLARLGQARKVKPEDGSFMKAIPTRPDICGVIPQGKSLFFTEPTAGVLHRMHMAAGSILMTYKLGGRPTGITHDGEAFWVADQESGEIRKMSI